MIEKMIDRIILEELQDNGWEVIFTHSPADTYQVALVQNNVKPKESKGRLTHLGSILDPLQEQTQKQDKLDAEKYRALVGSLSDLLFKSTK